MGMDTISVIAVDFGDTSDSHKSLFLLERIEFCSSGATQVWNLKPRVSCQP